MSTATYAIAPLDSLDNIFEGDNTHPLCLTPAEEGRLAFNMGDDLEDNPFDRDHNPIAWVDWHDGWMATQRESDRSHVEWEEYLDECEAMDWG